MKKLSRFTSLIYPYRWKMVLSFFLLVTLTSIDLAFPAIIRQVIDLGLTAGQQSFLLLAASFLIGLGILKALAAFGQRYLSEWIANHIAYDLRNRLYNHIQHMPFTFFDHTPSGQLISRCIEDVRSVQSFTGNGVVELARVSLLMLAILVILFSQNYRLALIALVPMVPMWFITLNYGRKIGKMFLIVDQDLGELSSRLQENVTGVQAVRAFAREAFEIEQFNGANKTLYRSQVHVTHEWSKIYPTTGQLVIVGTILLLWFGGQMVLSGEITLGQLVAFNSYMVLLAGPSQQLSWLVNSAGEASAGLQRAFDILDHQPEILSPTSAVSLPPLKGQVDFDHVSFQYSGEKTSALENINLSVSPNQVIALIGLTGSGKTSLINLIPRFYDVSEGSVRVDGYDVREVELTSLRRQIGIVLQTSLLFSDTVAENIAYGKPNATREEIITAAKAAQAHEFIMELPKQYETVVGERGVTLSGGQRQRLAIARALLLDPRILILDDSTSSVDTQTEHLLQQALGHLMEGRTTFIIAQRLSSVRRADLILVMDKGRIVERGTHTQLLAQNGLYREIYELQLRDQEQFAEDMQLLNTEQTQTFEREDNEAQITESME